MKSSIVFFSMAAIVLSSCSAVYRTAQTPDDIYYSPGREAADSYVQVDRKQDRAGTYRAEDFYSPEDRVLRMRVRNPNLWSAFDDYGYGGYGGYGMGYGGLGYGMGYSGLGYGMGYGGLGYGMGYGGLGYGLGYSGLGYGLGYGMPWYVGGLGLGFGYNRFYNNFYGWNSMYNPYYGGVVVIGDKSPRANTRLRTFNPNTYSNRTYNSTNATRPGTYRPNGRSGYNNSNTNTLGTSIRRVFSNGSNNTNSNAGRGSYYTPGSNDRPVRTYNPPSSTQTVRPMSSGSTGGGSTGGSRPAGGSTGGRPARGN